MATNAKCTISGGENAKIKEIFNFYIQILQGFVKSVLPIRHLTLYPRHRFPGAGAW
jgi:hypothetical protein